MNTADPFAGIPNASDDEYADTILETPQQRERRERQHTIDGPHYDTVGHNPGECLWEIPHCGPCWIKGEPRPANPWAKSVPLHPEEETGR
jgi:hypothetical protein